MMTLLA